MAALGQVVCRNESVNPHALESIKGSARQNSRPKSNIPVAARFVRKMRGGCQSHLLETADGVLYVVKFPENPQGRRVLVNELIGAALLSQIGLAVPAPSAIRITAAFLNENPNVSIQLSDRVLNIEPGLAFASSYPVDPNRDTVYDFLPDRCLQGVSNLTDFAAALVVDQWAANGDSRQAVFFRPRQESCGSRGKLVVQMIDNGQFFQGGSWALSGSPLSGLYRQPEVYKEVTGWESFEPYLEKITAIDDSFFSNLLKVIPCEWVDGDQIALTTLLERLMARRSRIPDLIADVRSHRPGLFPNWHENFVLPPYRVISNGLHALSAAVCSSVENTIPGSPGEMNMKSSWRAGWTR